MKKAQENFLLNNHYKGARQFAPRRKKMITLIELFDVTKFPMKDMESGEKVDSKIVLAHPNAIVRSIGFDWKTLEFTVEYDKEPEDADD